MLLEIHRRNVQIPYHCVINMENFAMMGFVSNLDSKCRLTHFKRQWSEGKEMWRKHVPVTCKVSAKILLLSFWPTCFKAVTSFANGFKTKLSSNLFIPNFQKVSSVSQTNAPFGAVNNFPQIQHFLWYHELRQLNHSLTIASEGNPSLVNKMLTWSRKYWQKQHMDFHPTLKFNKIMASTFAAGLGEKYFKMFESDT